MTVGVVNVVVLGGHCEHRWPGRVTVGGERFTLDPDDANCPMCGLLAGTVLFGEALDVADLDPPLI